MVEPMKIKNLNIKETVEKSYQEPDSIFVNIDFDYGFEKYEIDFTYDDCSELVDMEINKQDNNYHMILYRNEKCLRIFEKNNLKEKDNIFDIIQKKDCIHLESRYNDFNVYTYIKNGIVFYKTPISNKYIEVNEEQLSIHQIMFDEIVDENLIMNKIYPFLKKLNSEECKKLFHDIFNLRPENIIENEEVIESIENLYHKLKNAFLKNTAQIINKKEL